MCNVEDHLIAAQDSETGKLQAKANEDWQEEHSEFVERFMHDKQMRGICEYPPNGNVFCDTKCATCEYCHMPYRDPSLTRMRHISELLDVVLLDLAKIREG